MLKGREKMASPQVEDGYTRIANELFEEVIKLHIPRNELLVLLAIVRRTYGYGKTEDAISYAQLARMTGLDRKSIIRAVQGLEARNIIIVSGRGRGRGHVNVIAVQKDHERWEKGGSSATISTPRKGGSSATRKGGSSATHKRNKICIPVFDHWNEKGIIHHRTLTDRMKRAISGRLREGYTTQDLLQAIDNYHQVLNSDEHFFSYRWTLTDFLSRGLERFMSEARPLENFRKDRSRTQACRNAGAPYPRSQMTPSTLAACGCELCHTELRRRGGEP